MNRMVARALGGAAMLAFAGAAIGQALILREGTLVRVQTRNDISSKNAHVGDRVEFVVAEPVVVNGMTVVPAGAPATGEVARVRDSGLLGRSGKLDIKVSELVVEGQHVPLRGQRDVKGKSGTLGAVGAGVVFLPLAIVVKGREAKIKAGTTVDVYVDKDVPFALGGQAPPADQPIVAPTPPAG